jgi:class 3 adenylate cyclase/tetratricopeptide (TPR) repeat protein
MVGVRRHVPAVVVDWCASSPDARARTVPGSLLFADVSGFTALTERLAHKGRVGAEELVDTLSRVFGGMLDTAAQRGGDLLKFGGDALLFLFHDEGHAVRACDTAVELRRHLRDATREPTSVGRLQLSMSIGVHSGDVRLFLVGAPHRELVVAGATASTVVRLESLANAGDVLVSPTTAAQLPRGSTRARDDGELLLRWLEPRTPAQPPPPAPEVDDELLRAVLPGPLGAELAAGAPDPAHRVATVAFIRFSGTDALVDGPDDGAALAALETTLAAILGACADEGVTVVATDLDADGAKVMAVSGAPFASEDDEGRMLRALRRIARSDVPLSLQIGTNRGHVFAAEVGTSRRAAYSAMGDTTNTAARLMGKARPGVVMAHPSVLDASRTLFAATPAGPFTLKGKAVPVAAHEVGDELGPRPTEDRGLSLVGRDAELATLGSVFADLRAGRGRVVAVTGPAGIGKSRLVHELMARDPDDVTLALLRADPDAARSPYRVLRDPVRALLGIDAGDADAQAAQLAEVVGTLDPGLLPALPLLGDITQIAVPSTAEVDALEPEFRPDRTADAMLRLLASAIPGAFAVVLEDAQWCDAASADLMARLLERRVDAPTALIVTRRGGDGGFVPEGAEALELGPLPDGAVEQIVVELSAAAPLRPHDVRVIVERSEGNPLVAEEITRAARELGSADAVPQTVQAALTTQVDALEPHARRVLRRSSVLGRAFSRQALDEMLRQEGLELDGATLDGLGSFWDLAGSGRVRFRTGMIRDVVYDGLAYRERARLHGLAGLALEELADDVDAEAHALSLHFARAGDASRTWRYACLAAERARRTYANADAATQYELALDAARRLDDVAPTEVVDVWTRLGDVRELAGEFEASLDAYRRASRLAAGDPLAEAGLLLKRARARERAGAFTSALRELAVAHRRLEGVAGVEAGRMRARLEALGAVVRWGQERTTDALHRATSAAKAARDADEPAARAQALMIQELATLASGEPTDGSHLTEALEIFVALGDLPREAQARGNLGFLAAHTGRWDDAVDWLTTCRAAYTQAGDDVGAAIAALNLGEMLANQGHLDRADEELTAAVRVMAASGFTEGAAHGEMQLARIRLARGDVEGAAELADRARHTFVERRQASSALQAAVVRAGADVRAGRPTDALTLLDQAVAAAGREATSAAPSVAHVRARALLALDRADEAEAEVARGLEAAHRQEMPYEEAVLRWLAAELPGRSPAEQASERTAATATFNRLGVALPEGRPPT